MDELEKALADYEENNELERLRNENTLLRRQLGEAAQERIRLQGQIRNLLYQGEN
jgi:hypothetical protein